MAIFNTAIGTTNTTLESGAGDRAITTVIVCNTAIFDSENPTSGQTNLYLYAVPSSTSPITATQLIVNGLPIPAGETVTFDQEKIVLASGDQLIAKSDSPANLVATISILPV